MIVRSDSPRTTPPIHSHPAADHEPNSAAVAEWPGLAVAARGAGVPLDQDQLDRFDRFRDALLEWNDRFNLTAITDPDEVERRLLLDALYLVPVIDRLAAGGPARLVDIGSGAGFPGLPLAIARPDLAITLVEATGKKVSFLDHVIASLELPRVRAIHGRAEDVARERDHRGAYDLATARAVASLPALIELTMPLLRLGGHAVFPKGIELATELAAGERAAGELGASISGDEIVPGAATRIITVAKRRPTPDRYPRRAGIPASEPLGMTSADRTARQAAVRGPAELDQRRGAAPRHDHGARRRNAG